MNKVEKVYELIKELKQNNEDGLLDSRFLSRTLLSALSELGYTVPADTLEGLFMCGLCDARNKTPKVESNCTCPEKKNDGSIFDGIDYYCPTHGR